ncbi:MAG: phenylalanine--tRNA ligase subunit alpha, partial [Thermoanaerobaculia bacterium]|nr:phenylalanine--tRNA ligase subunit alpha [Thermoanaerobaculia bacterium]
MERIEKLEASFEAEAAEVSTREEWEELRLHWVGRKRGIVRELLSSIGDAPPEERAEYGQAVNAFRDRVETRLESLDEEIREEERKREAARRRIDVTLPGRRPRLGSLHAVTHVFREIEEIFQGLGYSVAEGPEIETDFHNFEALNMPPDHPARDTQDTFFVEGGRVLRTHTSPV